MAQRTIVITGASDGIGAAAGRSSAITWHRPWVVEPGMWAQYDFGDGPEVGGAATVLFCLWLAWCRFRVVIPIWDKTSASV